MTGTTVCVETEERGGLLGDNLGEYHGVEVMVMDWSEVGTIDDLMGGWNLGIVVGEMVLVLESWCCWHR